MKKFISFIMILALLTLQFSLSLTSQAEETSESSKISVNKGISSFYPSDSLFVGYFKYTNENLDKIKSLIAKYSKNESSNKDLLEALNVFSNLTTELGPDVSFGQLKPQNDEKQLYLGIIETKNEKFSPTLILNLFSPDKQSETIDYKGYQIQKTNSQSKISYVMVKKNFLLSNSVTALKMAIDNHIDKKNSILSPLKAQEAASMIPKDYFLSVITNNIALIEYSAPMIPNNPISNNTEIKDNYQLVANNEPDSSIAKEYTFTKNLNISEDQKKYIQKYYNEFIKTENYSSLTLDVSNNLLNLTTYTPYSADFLASINPKLQESLGNLFKPEKQVIASKLLPENTSAYIMISNISSINNIINDIDQDEFHNLLITGKFFITAFTGLDFDNQLIPMFNGYNILTVTKDENDLTPFGFISYNDSTLKTVDDIFGKIITSDNSISTENINLELFQFRKVNFKKESLDIGYGKYNDSILFGEIGKIKNYVINNSSPNNTLYDAVKFESYRIKTSKDNFLELYVNFNDLSTIDKYDLKNILSKDITNIIDSLFVYMETTKNKGYLSNILINLH